MRGFSIGLVVLLTFSVTVLSLRPGGLRRQLTFAARRFRIALVLGGVYVITSTAIRVWFKTGAIADYGPPIIAAALMVAYLFLARDPKSAQESVQPSRGH